MWDNSDDSNSDLEIKTDNEYAKNYNNWRKKEELNKLKTKYGVEELDQLDNNEDSSSSSDDDEDGVELTEKVERDFFKTLSYLKNKDPRIYDENVKFFEDDEDAGKTQKKKKKEKPLYLKDYERKLLLEKNGELSDNEEDVPRTKSPTYVEEQEMLRNFNTNDSDDDSDSFLKIRQKPQEVELEDKDECKQWLAGKKKQIQDKEIADVLKPLKDYWNNPNLEEGEKFLKDYILNKRFLSKEDETYIPTYDEVVHDSDKDLSEDEKQIEAQEEFERKYNFRFEEPDQEFIKRYPRTMESSLRKTDDRRKVKRAETKERKLREKQEKMQDLKKLQELKRQEIEEKMEKLKEITGNTDMTFQEEDIEGDFDPEAHDKRMEKLFNEEFYEGPEGDQKPEFPELDEYLEIDNWEKWTGDENKDNEESLEPHCEDEDFNMDCDYDPGAAHQNELVENSKGKKKRKRKSLFAKALSEPKPVFDPNDKTYEEYLDEYYKLDCEDIIGDIPCRFKYRKVVPNSFGLSIDEILTANDRELNKWCSLKKAVQHRPDHVEKYDQIAFQKKASKIELKKRILPSLFVDENEEETTMTKSKLKKMITDEKLSMKSEGKFVKEAKKETVEVNKKEDQPVEVNSTTTKSKKKKQKMKTAQTEGDFPEETTNAALKINDEVFSLNQSSSVEANQTVSQSKKKKRKTRNTQNESSISVISDNNTKDDSINNKKTKNRKKKETENHESNFTKKRKRSSESSGQTTSNKFSKKLKKDKFKKNKKAAENTSIPDARLSAYGLNPKKFKNKLKYGKKQ